MLIITRKKNEAVYIGNEIKVIVTKIDVDPKTGYMSVRLGIKAPLDMKILREELKKDV